MNATTWLGLACLVAVPTAASAISLRPAANPRRFAMSSEVSPLLADAAAASQPTDADAASQPTDAERKRKARRDAAWPLVVVTAIGIGAVGLALAIWIIHWGNRLRRQSRPRRDQQDDSDPWKAAGERLNVDPDQQQENEQ